MMRATDARMRRDDTGLGLPELIVTMVLLSVVSLVVLTLTVSVSRAFARDQTATDNTNTAAIAMNEVTRVLRAGTEIRRSGNPVNTPVFLEATHSKITLHAFLDTESADARPVKITFELNSSGELTETRYPAKASTKPYWEFQGAASSTRVIARGVTPSTTVSPLFAYLNTDGPMPLPGGSGFTAEQRATIAAVAVSLEVQSNPGGRAGPVEIQNTVGIPNLNYSRMGL